MILERIKQYIDLKGISISAFERSIGMSNASFGKSLKNGGAIGSDKLENILKIYPDISPSWLMTGTGEMLRSEQSGISSSLTQTDLVSGKNYIPPTAPLKVAPINQHKRADTRERGSIPLVSEKAVGGFYNEDFKIAERDIIGYYVIPKFRHLDVDFMIEVIGDSMLPRFFPGDIIACSIISNPNFIQWNKCHLIATREQGLIIKRLMPGDDKTSFKAISDNKDYPPFSIPKDEICGLARIVGSIHVE